MGRELYSPRPLNFPRKSVEVCRIKFVLEMYKGGFQTMLIAIDHGNKSVKLPCGDPFVSGLVESEVAPFGKDVLKYRGRYYQLSDYRIPYHRDKTEDERFFILTLFAIAREINSAGRYTAGTIQVQLAVGLPPAHFGAQHQEFTSYFLGRGPVSFIYRQKSYTILINDVVCFPQSYAAAVTLLPTLQNESRALVLDIGGFTADYLQLRNGEGNLAVCDSLESGVISLYNKIISRVNAEHDILLDEEEIDAILLKQKTPATPDVAKIVERKAQDFINDLFSTLRERGLELKTGKVVFVGGGSILLRRQILASGKIGSALFVEDVRANAKGYELLYRAVSGSR